MSTIIGQIEAILGLDARAFIKGVGEAVGANARLDRSMADAARAAQQASAKVDQAARVEARAVQQAAAAAERAAAQEEAAARRAAKAVEDAARRKQKDIDSTNRKVLNLGRSFLAIAGIGGVGMFVRSITEAGAKLDGLERGLGSIVGSAQQTEEQLKRLAIIAKLPGLSFQEAVQGSTRLQAVGFSANQAERFLKSFGNAIAMVGGGRAELERTTLALGQIAGKTQGFGQDIRQLIEASPAFAKAIRDVFGTMDGELIAAQTGGGMQFVEMLSTQLEKLPQVSGGAKVGLENLSDASFRLRAELGKKLLTELTPTIEKVVGFTERILENEDALNGLATSLSTVVQVLGGMLSPLAKAVEGWGLLFDIMGKASDGSKTFALSASGPIGNVVQSALNLAGSKDAPSSQDYMDAIMADHATKRAAAEKVKADALAKSRAAEQAAAAAAEKAAEATKKAAAAAAKAAADYDAYIDSLLAARKLIQQTVVATHEYTKATDGLVDLYKNVTKELDRGNLEVEQRNKLLLEQVRIIDDLISRGVVGGNFTIRGGLRDTSTGPETLPQSKGDPWGGAFDVGSLFSKDSLSGLFDFKQIMSSLASGGISAGIGLLGGLVSKFLDFGSSGRMVQEAMERAREAMARAAEAQEAYNRTLTSAFNADSLLTEAERFEREFRALFEDAMKAFGADSPGMRNLLQRGSMDDFRNMGEDIRRRMAEGQEISEFEQQVLKLLDLFDQATKRTADNAAAIAAALAAENAQKLAEFTTDLAARQADHAGDSVAAAQIRAQFQADQELAAAYKLYEAGVITQEMFEQLGIVLRDDVANAIQAAADAIQNAIDSLNDSLTLAEFEQAGDAAAAAAFRAHQQAEQWRKEAERLGQGQDVFDRIQKWLDTELARINAPGGSAGAVEAADTAARTAFTVASVTSITSMQAIRLIDISRSQLAVQQEMAASLRGMTYSTTRGDSGAPVQPSATNNVTVEIASLEIQAGVVVADNQGIRTLARRLANDLDEILGDKIARRRSSLGISSVN